MGLLLLAVGLAGCGTPSADMRFAEVLDPSQTQAATASPDSAARNLDTFAVGDTLTITFTEVPTVMQPIEDRIREDGTITLLQNQTFVAAGKTRGALEREIREVYVPKYFKTMTVNVRHQRESQFYFVGGEVKLPGRQLYISRMTVLKAIQSCGDFTDFANRRKVQLTRLNGTKFTINANKAIENPNLDLEIFPGDRINVPRRVFW
jgi:protein involved in polysaccharide export with SLBB domain